MKISATNAVKAFKCLQAECPDTCCKGWSMQLDDITFEKYKVAGLEEAVSYDGQVRVMRRDPKTDFCVKFEGGICSIHKNKGPEYLGDACNFYPRVTRNLGDETVMTLTPSCPEALRLMLIEAGENYSSIDAERLPSTLKDWLDEGISPEDAVKIHNRFLAECGSDAPANKVVARIWAASGSLAYIDQKDWAGAVDFMFRMADGKIPLPEKSVMDEYNILQIFLGLLHATGKARSERLAVVLDAIAVHLNVDIDFGALVIMPKGEPQKNADPQDEILKRYIATQISFSTYPFAGIGEDIQEKAKVLLFKFSLVRLALKAWDGDVIDCIQPLSRIVDHIADSQLMLRLMSSFGWDSESRLMGLLEE
jgi:hypothetical protein